MCGVAGIFLKGSNGAGGKIVRMLKAIEHRGPDSTGVAIFDPGRDQLRVVVGCPDDNRLRGATGKLETLGVSFGEVTRHSHFILVTAFPKDEDEAHKVIGSVQSVKGCSIYCYGRQMTIVKDTFPPEELGERFQLQSIPGSFAIGHVRLATESRVNPFWSHPFQSLAMPDLSIVHNGQITNFFTKKRQLEKKGYLFQTDNDSEVIAQEIAMYMLEQQMPFDKALRAVADGLDGAFSIIVAAPNALGVAKDRLATKPLMVAETADAVALASEEIAIEMVLGSEVSAEELAPGEVFVWDL